MSGFKKNGFKGKFNANSFQNNKKGNEESNNTDSGSGDKKFKMNLKMNTQTKPAFKKALKGFEAEEKIENKIKEEKILGFSKNKVESAESEVKKGPLVIPFVGKEKGWRIKRKATYLPQEAKMNKNSLITNSSLDAEEGERKYGLIIKPKREVQIDENEVELAVPEKENIKNDDKPLSLEEQARLEVMKDATGETQENFTVIPLITDQRKTEDEAFKEDFENAPDESTLEDYERVPIEGFGAGVLRGMGWVDGMAIGSKKRKEDSKPYQIVRRPRLLGLGAKPKPPNPYEDKKFKKQ